MLEELKSAGGPFTSVEEVDDFLMREVPEFDGKKIQNAEVTDCFST